MKTPQRRVADGSRGSVTPPIDDLNPEASKQHGTHQHQWQMTAFTGPLLLAFSFMVLFIVFGLNTVLHKPLALVEASLAESTEHLRQQRSNVEVLRESYSSLVRGSQALAASSVNNGDARYELPDPLTNPDSGLVKLKAAVAEKEAVQEKDNALNKDALMSYLPKKHVAPPTWFGGAAVNQIGAPDPGGKDAMLRAGAGYPEYDEGVSVGPPAKPEPDEFESLSSEEKTKKRQEAVVAEFKHSWNAYVRYAWGSDELMPRSKKGKNWSKDPQLSLGLTIMDSLTTMHLMGLEAELEKAMSWIRTDLDFEADINMSAFEATIRVVGSLLSLFELRGEKEEERFLVKKAAEMANRLLHAYNTSSGIPHQTVNLQTHRHFNPRWLASSSVLAEFGTVQLELRTLSYHTKDPVYDIKATHIMSIIEGIAPDDMLCPVYYSIDANRWSSQRVTLGGLGDSFYEYLLKQYLLTGQTESKYLRMYERAVKGVKKKLLRYSEPSKWAYLAGISRGGMIDPKMDHLACFAGAMLARGAQLSEIDETKREAQMRMAADLTETCYKFYSRQKTGISPESVIFLPGKDFVNDGLFYILRPETMEAIFYMWRYTKDEKYREWGWFIFSKVRKYCKVKSGGYAGLKDVTMEMNYVQQDDMMQSFWMAETMKYFYLLFSDDDTLDFEKWVLNTEAHPLKVRKRDPLDVWRAWENDHDGDLPWYPPTLSRVKVVETEKMKEKRESGMHRYGYQPQKRRSHVREEFSDDLVAPVVVQHKHRRGDDELRTVRPRAFPTKRPFPGGGGGNGDYYEGADHTEKPAQSPDEREALLMKEMAKRKAEAQERDRKRKEMQEKRKRRTLDRE